jgi:phytoene desaturase
MRSYRESWWNKKVLAPSALLFFLGLNKRLQNVLHHTLLFDQPFDPHAEAIYDQPRWPENPLFYMSCASITDPHCAPEGKENVTLLIPIAPDLDDTEETRQMYFDTIIKRLENLTGQLISDSIVLKRSYCINDFRNDYHSYKGNAYGLANTLLQTAFLRPKIKSRKLSNLYFAGQLTVPGPGVPPSIISGKIAATEIFKHHPVS